MMEATFVNGDCFPVLKNKPSLCRTCIYWRFLNRPIGFDDEPRLRGPYLRGRAEEPCVKCSANPSYSLFFASRGKARRLKGCQDLTILRSDRVF